MKEVFLVTLIGLLFAMTGIACALDNVLLQFVLSLVAIFIHTRFFQLKSDNQKGGEHDNDES